VTSTILPPNASRLERDLEATIAAVADVPKAPIATLWDPATCPAPMLPWLAWGLSIDRWETSWTEAEKRTAIAGAIEAQRRKGTPASVEAVLASLDQLLELVEWFENGGDPHTFEIRYPLTGAPADRRTAAWAEKIVREVSIVKPVRSHFRLIQQFAAAADLRTQGASRAMAAHRFAGIAAVDTSQPWEAFLQTEFGEPLVDGAGNYLEDA
jgi:phage tail P2-like protein